MMHERIERVTISAWPRLMGVDLAAKYLGISPTSVREHGPQPKSMGSRRLYDIRDLDRWADRLDEQPLDATQEKQEADDIERRFLEDMRAGG